MVPAMIKNPFPNEALKLQALDLLDREGVEDQQACGPDHAGVVMSTVLIAD